MGNRILHIKKKVVTPSIYYPKYGNHFNYFAVVDSRKITSSDNWVVPSPTQLNSLYTYLGGAATAAGILKVTGTEFWNSPNTGATNAVGFNLRGCGYRIQTTGEFTNEKIQVWLASNSLYFSDWDVDRFRYDSAAVAYNFVTQQKVTGCSVRLLYVGSGTPAEYVGNDGKRYRIAQIGSHFWLADNLAETRFRNGDIIPWHGANPANYFTNAEWAALTTPGVCAYNNDMSNVGPGFSFPT